MVGMAMLQAAVVMSLLAVVLYAVVRLTGRPADAGLPAVTRGRWRVGHYDLTAETRVVLQKVSEGGTAVLDEHVIASIGTADPEYDEKFLAAMNTARQRQALFESEEGG
jgi:hypothetical protein